MKWIIKYEPWYQGYVVTDGTRIESWYIYKYQAQQRCDQLNKEL